jgi:hypothetical protein
MLMTNQTKKMNYYQGFNNVGQEIRTANRRSAQKTTMKQKIYILAFLILTSCGQSNSEQEIPTVSDTVSTGNILIVSYSFIIDNNLKVQHNFSEEDHSIDDSRKESLSDFEKATLYKLTDTISADYNGDGFIDKAFYKKENETSGIIIKHGQTNEEFKIGFGKQFAHLTEFNWVDFWGLVEDRETSETTFMEDGDVLGSKWKICLDSSILLTRKAEPLTIACN